MPGLTDAHWHATMVRATPAIMLGSDLGYSTLLGGRRGHRHADARLHHHPRPRRSLVQPEARHRRRACCPGRGSIRPGRSSLSPAATATFASSIRPAKDPWRDAQPCRAAWRSHDRRQPDEVRLRVREQLMQGASQIKLTAGGGVASPFSPLDVSTFTEAELARRGGSRRELGHLCRHPCLHTGFDPALDRGGRQSASSTAT